MQLSLDSTAKQRIHTAWNISRLELITVSHKHSTQHLMSALLQVCATKLRRRVLPNNVGQRRDATHGPPNDRLPVNATRSLGLRYYRGNVLSSIIIAWRARAGILGVSPLLAS